MCRLLVLYGTTYGHTAKVARFLAETLVSPRVQVDIAPADVTDPDPSAYAGVIVAGSIVAGHFQRPVRRWVSAHRAELATRPTLFLAVCLSIQQREIEVLHDLAGITNRFFLRTGWVPDQVEFVAGSLPYSRYNWLVRWMMVRIVRKAGGDTDTSRDYEYTDWEGLAATAERYLERVTGPVPVQVLAHH